MCVCVCVCVRGCGNVFPGMRTEKLPQSPSGQCVCVCVCGVHVRESVCVCVCVCASFNFHVQFDTYVDSRG